MKTLLKIIFTGVADTFATDIWTFILKLSDIHSYGLLLAGKWIISHIPLGVQNHLEGKQLLMGWTTLYCLGIFFSFLLILMYGKKWFQKPTMVIALIFTLITFAISLFVIQTILNIGVAFSKFQIQPLTLLKVFAFHIIYSLGLYAFALVLKGRTVCLNEKTGFDYGN